MLRFITFIIALQWRNDKLEMKKRKKENQTKFKSSRMSGLLKLQQNFVVTYLNFLQAEGTK